MDALGINLPGLVAQIINFTILLTVLYLLLYKPVTRMLDQRGERIKESLEQADRLKAESAEAEEAVRKQIEDARQEGRGIVAQATQVAERVREEAREQARRDAELITARAQADIQRERDEALEQLRAQFSDLAILAAERVINSSLDEAQHRELIEEVLQEGMQNGASQN